MVTDNWPVDFTYISHRLVTKIVQQDKGHRPRRGPRPTGFGVDPGPSVSLEWATVDWSNPFELVRRATEAVRDHTGHLDACDPHDRIPTGRYIRAKMHLQQMGIDVPVWEANAQYPIVAFAGYEQIGVYGRVFLGLVGSAINLPSRTGGPPLRYSGRTPSDAIGLYDIIQRNREWTERGLEPAVSEFELNRERVHLATEEDRMRAAAELFTGSDLYETGELVDLLFEVHHEADNFDLGISGPDGHQLGPFRRALFGAPVWISTPLPEMDHALLRPGWRAYQNEALENHDGTVASWRWNLTPLRHARPDELYLRIGPQFVPSEETLTLTDPPSAHLIGTWDRFEQWATAYSSVLTHLSESETLVAWPPKGEVWADFCSWTVDQALRLGPDPIPFQNRIRTFKWSRLRHETRSEYLDGEVGWLLHGNEPARGGDVAGGT